jgi:hypothetical protein
MVPPFPRLFSFASMQGQTAKKEVIRNVGWEPIVTDN